MSRAMQDIMECAKNHMEYTAVFLKAISWIEL